VAGEGSELLLLGRPLLRIGDAEVCFPTRKAAGLLAYLAIEGPTARSAIAGILWADWPEPEARRNLRQELYRLQRLPGTGLEAGPETLALGAGVAVDAARFRERLAEGAIEEALSLYRGPLLEGVEVESPLFLEWLERRRQSFGELRRSALARRAAVFETAGRHVEALRAYEELLAEDELQETHQRAAIRLLHLLGERDAALKRFQRFADMLREELEVDPLPETLRLANRIRSRPAPEPPVAPPKAATVRLEPPLVGRETAWRQVEEASGVALLVGEPGAGKSRLAAELAAAHPPHLAVHGQEISSGTPLYAVAGALREAWANPASRLAVGELDPVWRNEAARLVPELSTEPAGPPTPEGRARFLEGVGRVLLAAARGGTIVFDDLQWLDTMTVELLVHLARAAARPRLVAAARAEDLAANQAVAGAVQLLEREGRLTRVPLEPLSGRGVQDLVWALSGRDAALFSRRLLEATGGNPLFVLETLRALFSSGELYLDEGGNWATRYDEETRDYAELPVPESVRAAVLQRVDRLGPEARRLLEAASLAGERFDAETLGGATALSEWEALGALEKAQKAQVLIAAGPAPVAPGTTADGPSYRFAHELVRRSLCDGLSPERKRLLLGKLAAARAARGAAPGELASYLERAGRPEEAIPHRVRAAEAALRVYAHRQALDQYEWALHDGAAGLDAFRIHSARVELLRFLDDSEARRAALDAMTETARSLSDPEVQAELAIKRSVHQHEVGRPALALEEAEQALERLGDRISPAARAALGLEAGASLVQLGRPRDAEARLSAVLEPARTTSALKHANVCYWLAHCARARDDSAAARAHLDAAIAGTARVGHRRGHAMALRARGLLAVDTGIPEAGAADLLAALSEVREIGNRDLEKSMVEELRALAPRLVGEPRAALLRELDGTNPAE